MVEFGQFRLDLDSGELHRGSTRIILQQKVYRALAVLVQRYPSVVGREELCWALWPDGESVDFEHGLNTAIKRLRTALADSSVSPALIETVPRRGYRFIGPLTPHRSVASSPGHHVFVGRHRELDVLRDTFARAVDGYPQCLLVVGEPGIGKTALIHRFLQESSAVFVAEGQAMGAYGADDPFGPVLEAIRRLGVAHAGVVGLLARHAPSWLPHLPSLVRRADANSLATTSPSRPRMLREFLAFLEAAAAERPILLLLEDVHWADEPTLELVQAVASSNMRARVLVICTYRPLAGRSGAWISDILRELKSRGRAIALDLQGLTMEETQAYVEVRLPRLQRPAALGAALHERTDGNPLFLGACVEALRNDGQVAENDAST